MLPFHLTCRLYLQYVRVPVGLIWYECCSEDLLMYSVVNGRNTHLKPKLGCKKDIFLHFFNFFIKKYLTYNKNI